MLQYVIFIVFNFITLCNFRRKGSKILWSHWRQWHYLKKKYWWSTEGFAYLPGNKVSTCFSVRPHQAHEGWAAGLVCSSGRDSWLIRAWSIDLEYRQIYYCGRTMRAHSCNYRPNQYWLEIIERKKKASNANRQFFKKINGQLQLCQMLINMWARRWLYTFLKI